MLATPTYPSYYHNPKDTFNYLKALNPKEQEIFTLGYLQASYQMQEVISDAKRPILNNLLDEDRSEEARKRLQTYVKILDSLDRTLENRISELKATL